MHKLQPSPRSLLLLIRTIILTSFIKEFLHRRILVSKLPDGQTFSLVVGQTEVILGTKKLCLCLLESRYGLVNLFYRSLELFASQAVYA